MILSFFIFIPGIRDLATRVPGSDAGLPDPRSGNPGRDLMPDCQILDPVSRINRMLGNGWHPEDGDKPLEDRRLYLFGRIYYGNIKNKKNLIQDKIKNWNLSGQVVWQGQVECVELEPILDDFYQFINKYPHIKDDLLNVFDPAFSMPYRKALNSEGFISRTRTYSPKFMTNPIRRLQRMAELKGIYILENPNEAIKWQAGNGVVNELSRNWCMLNRMNKSPQLNVDYWSATLLALSELLIPKRECVIGVF